MSSTNGSLINGDHSQMLLDPATLHQSDPVGLKKSVSASRFVVDVVPKPSETHLVQIRHAVGP